MTTIKKGNIISFIEVIDFLSSTKLLSVSLSSAKKKVEIQIAKKGSKTIEEKRQVAQDLLKTCENDNGNKLSSSKILDKLMSTLENEDNFITED